MDGIFIGRDIGTWAYGWPRRIFLKWYIVLCIYFASQIILLVLDKLTKSKRLFYQHTFFFFFFLFFFLMHAYGVDGDNCSIEKWDMVSSLFNVGLFIVISLLFVWFLKAIFIYLKQCVRPRRILNTI